MRIVIVSDAWLPQVNGVVRTLMRTVDELKGLGHEMQVISPDLFRSVPCPTYAEIRLAVLPRRHMTRLIDSFQPCAIHIATEGPLGLAARRYCLRRKLPFTTAFHTRFPEYVKARIGLPLPVGYAALRRFHKPASGVMVATASLEHELAGRGFRNLRRWTRGVDTDLFRPRDKSFLDLPRPVHLYVGRVAVEKNIEAFLKLELAGSKIVVGGGPQLAELSRRYPEVRFAGPRQGENLARHYAAADVFVFPSRTDTFGLVLLEALASSVPVAAYPVPGPLDVVDGAGVGFLDEDLASAARHALAISPEACRRYALQFSWQRSAAQFLGNLQPFDPAINKPEN
ncbi:MAG TPA: glycosyltransferase family 1 protein [Dongiaceae bacterium]|nr:glycosyltransferase family 1 protein [Dongiaceae bacterium]